MRILIVAAVAALGLSTAALAEQPAAKAPAAAAPAAAKFTLDTPIETIAADPAGKAVLDKDMPGLTTHASYESFKQMSLKALQPMSQGAITDDAMTKTAADLAALK